MSHGQSADEDAVVVFSDYVCPFCYLGRESLSQFQARRAEPVPTRWHPFDLRGQVRGPDREIDPDADDGKDEAYFDRVRENVASLSEEYGVDLDIDAVPDIDSWNAQQAALFVREEHPDSFAAYDDALFAAYWTGHRDIGDPDVLGEIAERVGVGGADVDSRATIREAVASEAWADRLETAFETATEQGITGVPTFVYGDHAARGAVPPDHLDRLVGAAEK